MENIFVTSTFNEKIVVESKYLNSSLDSTILNILKDRFENRCFKTYGYIKENSIEIIKRDCGIVNKGDFSGNINYNIVFKADVCNPVIDNVIEGTVKQLSKIGPLISYDDIPINIFIYNELEEDKKTLSNIKVNDTIRVKVIGKNIDLVDNKIIVISKLAKDEKFKKLKIEKQKIKNKKQDSDFIESDSNFDFTDSSNLGEEEEKGEVAEDTSFDIVEEEGLKTQNELSEKEGVGEYEAESNLEFNEEDEFDYS